MANLYLPHHFWKTLAVSDSFCTPEIKPRGSYIRPAGVAALCFAIALAILSFPPGLFAQRRIPIPLPTQPVRPRETKVSLLKMRVEDGRITADITDAPLQQVLKELADRTGIVFEVRGVENPLVSIHLQRVSPVEAIQRIADGKNAIFYYGQGAESDRVIMVRIFSRSNPGPQPDLLYLGTGAVTKTNNALETPEEALQVLDSNSSVEQREIAIEILAQGKSDAGAKALIECLADPAPEIRVAAIEGLTSMGAQEALPGILKALKDQHPSVRNSAAMAVASLGNARNLKDLRPLSADKDAGVAAAAEIAIRRLSATEKK